MANSECALLDNVDLIQELEKSKQQQQTIKTQENMSKNIVKDFNNHVKNYTPLAKRVAELYFTISDLQIISPT